MSSENRTAVNRQNAQLSTGPRTDRGKRKMGTAAYHGSTVSSRTVDMPLSPFFREESSEALSNRTAVNRQNASHSTGPRTPEGKARSSMNSLKHGLRAKTDVIPGDRPYSYKSYRRQLLLELNPTSLLEHELADCIIGDLWRLKRIPKLESAIFREMRTKEPSVPPALAELAIALANKKRNLTDTYDSPSSSESSRDKGRRASSSLLSRSVLADKLHSAYPSSTGWLDYSEHFARFSRYESSLERSLFHCLKELRDARKSTPCSTPENPANQTELSRPLPTLSNSSNPNPRNHFHRHLYQKGLGSFGNSTSIQTVSPLAPPREPILVPSPFFCRNCGFCGVYTYNWDNCETIDRLVRLLLLYGRQSNGGQFSPGGFCGAR